MCLGGSADLGQRAGRGPRLLVRMQLGNCSHQRKDAGIPASLRLPNHHGEAAELRRFLRKLEMKKSTVLAFSTLAALTTVSACQFSELPASEQASLAPQPQRSPAEGTTQGDVTLKLIDLDAPGEPLLLREIISVGDGLGANPYAPLRPLVAELDDAPDVIELKLTGLKSFDPKNERIKVFASLSGCNTPLGWLRYGFPAKELPSGPGELNVRISGIRDKTPPDPSLPADGYLYSGCQTSKFEIEVVKNGEYMPAWGASIPFNFIQKDREGGNS